MADVDARSIDHQGVGLAIAVISPIVFLSSIFAVAVRVHMRRLEGTFAIDDVLLVGGLVRCIYFCRPRTRKSKRHELTRTHN